MDLVLKNNIQWDPSDENTTASHSSCINLCCTFVFLACLLISPWVCHQEHNPVVKHVCLFVSKSQEYVHGHYLGIRAWNRSSVRFLGWCAGWKDRKQVTFITCTQLCHNVVLLSLHPQSVLRYFVMGTWHILSILKNAYLLYMKRKAQFILFSLFF